MLAIAWQTLRTRRATLAGAFAAVFLAVAVAYACGLLMTGALSAPGPGRLAAADAVVRADPSVAVDAEESVDVAPAPRLPNAAVARVASVPGVARAIGDVAFAAGAFDRAGRSLSDDRVRGHGWPSAALTPYELRAGRPPAGPREVVADERLGVRVGDELRVAAPGGDGGYRVSGIARGAVEHDAVALFFTATAAGSLSGAPGEVNAVGVIAEPGVTAGELRARLEGRLGSAEPDRSGAAAGALGSAEPDRPGAAAGAVGSAEPDRPGAAAGGALEVLDRDHAADADAGDESADARTTLVAIFGTMGGIAGSIALFVVAGTFSLAIAQRRRETAVLRALGATPPQVRRLISGEALLVSLAATGLGVLAGGPLADAIARAVVEQGTAPHGFEPVRSWIALAAAAGLGIGISQLAVVAAAHRAGRIRPAEALREAAVEHGRPGWVRVLAGLACLGGGAAIALVFSGEAASAYAILGAMLLAGGVALLGRWLLGLPAAALARPLRGLGAAGHLAGTALSANRWRSAALATPILLVAMLAGTQATLQASDESNTEAVTAERITATHAVAGRDGAPLPADTSARVARLPGVEAATATLPTEVFLLDHGLTGWDAPWAAAGVDVAGADKTLDLHVLRGDLEDVGGSAVAVSEVVASEGDLAVGDVVSARMADTRRAELRVVAIYDRAAGLGHVVLDASVAWSHAVDLSGGTVFVAGGDAAARSLARYAATHPGVEALTVPEYLETVEAANQEDAWAIWLIIAMSVGFAALALVNTAAMATTERRDELATIRLLGGTSGQATRMIALELVPTVAAGLLAGGAVAALAVMGVPDGVRGIPLVVPVAATGGLLLGAALLALAAGVVAVRLALRSTPAAALRVRE